MWQLVLLDHICGVGRSEEACVFVFSVSKLSLSSHKPCPRLDDVRKSDVHEPNLQPPKISQWLGFSEDNSIKILLLKLHVGGVYAMMQYITLDHGGALLISIVNSSHCEDAVCDKPCWDSSYTRGNGFANGGNVGRVGVLVTSTACWFRHLEWWIICAKHDCVLINEGLSFGK